MLYLKSVIFYIVLLLATEFVCKERIIQNGWTTREALKTTTRTKGWMAIISVAVIPIFRFLVVSVLFMMAGMTKDAYEQKMRVIKEVDDEDN